MINNKISDILDNNTQKMTKINEPQNDSFNLLEDSGDYFKEGIQSQSDELNHDEKQDDIIQKDRQEELFQNDCFNINKIQQPNILIKKEIRQKGENQQKESEQIINISKNQQQHQQDQQIKTNSQNSFNFSQKNEQKDDQIIQQWLQNQNNYSFDNNQQENLELKQNLQNKFKKEYQNQKLQQKPFSNILENWNEDDPNIIQNNLRKDSQIKPLQEKIKDIPGALKQIQNFQYSEEMRKNILGVLVSINQKQEWTDLVKSTLCKNIIEVLENENLSNHDKEKLIFQYNGKCTSPKDHDSFKTISSENPVQEEEKVEKEENFVHKNETARFQEDFKYYKSQKQQLCPFLIQEVCSLSSKFNCNLLHLCSYGSRCSYGKNCQYAHLCQRGVDCVEKNNCMFYHTCESNCQINNCKEIHPFMSKNNRYDTQFGCQEKKQRFQLRRKRNFYQNNQTKNRRFKNKTFHSPIKNKNYNEQRKNQGKKRRRKNKYTNNQSNSSEDFQKRSRGIGNAYDPGMQSSLLLAYKLQMQDLNVENSE